MYEIENCIGWIDRVVKANDDDLEEELNAAGYENTKETIEEINKLEEKITEILEQEKEDIKNGIVYYSSVEAIIDGIENIIDKNKISGAISEKVAEAFKKFMPELINAYLQSTDKDLSFKYFSPATTEFINNWSDKLGDLIHEQDKNTLNNILNKGLETGASIQDIADSLDEKYQWGETRARKIALTEVLTAHSYSKHEAFMQSPAVTEIEWKHSGGKGINPRLHHVDLDGKTVKKGEKFTIYAPNGTFEAMFPRDVTLPASERVNCHCTHGPVIDNVILGLSKEEKEQIQSEAIENLTEY